jgi:multidrug transporter EmrE-like cation transporter
MTGTLALGLLLAVATAVATNPAYLMKHRGAVAAPDVEMHRPLATAADLFRQRWWTIGWIVAAVGFLTHAVAVGLAPLSLAKAVIAGGLVILGVLAERFFGFELQRRQWLGVALVAAGMAFLGITTSEDASHSTYSTSGMIAFEGGLIALGLALILCCGLRGLRERRGVLLGTASGVLIGVSDIAIKALTGTVPDDALAIISPWTLIALLCGVAAFYTSAKSLQVGEGITVITATSAAANLSAIVGGILVFGDSLGNDPLQVIGRVTAFVFVIVAVSLMPAPVRAAEATDGGQAQPATAT